MNMNNRKYRSLKGLRKGSSPSSSSRAVRKVKISQEDYDAMLNGVIVKFIKNLRDNRK